MEIVLALGSALAYGVSDFAGGVLAKRAHAFTVILRSQVISCAILVVVLPFWNGPFSWQAIGWGAAAGVFGVSGASLMYRGLAIGRMGVVAPITAVLAAAIPVTFGFAAGERPASIALIGVAVGLVAVVLISSAPEPRMAPVGPPSRRRWSALAGAAGPGVPEAFGAGVGFGLWFVLLERAPEQSGLWPLVGTRISIVALVALLAAIARVPFRATRGTALSLVWLGFTNLGADLLYLLATRAGLLSLVAVITSLYPAATVALARALLHERMVKQQLFGVVCAGLSVTLIALR